MLNIRDDELIIFLPTWSHFLMKSKQISTYRKY